MQPENQKVLAAIVTFNGAETIRETITALKEQNLTPDAFLIIEHLTQSIR